MCWNDAWAWFAMSRLRAEVRSSEITFCSFAGATNAALTNPVARNFSIFVNSVPAPSGYSLSNVLNTASSR